MATPELDKAPKRFPAATSQLPPNRTRKSSHSPSINCKIVLAMVAMTLSITTLPTEFLTQIEMPSLCTPIPIIFNGGHKKGCFFLGKFEQRTQNVLQRAPFKCVRTRIQL